MIEELEGQRDYVDEVDSWSHVQYFLLEVKVACVAFNADEDEPLPRTKILYDQFLVTEWWHENELNESGEEDYT